MQTNLLLVATKKLYTKKKKVKSVTTNNNFGEEIKTIRTYNQMTIREVAKQAGISHSYLSQIENNRRDTPNPEVIKKIAIGLNADYYYLLKIAGYHNNSYSNLNFLNEQVQNAPEEFKKQFMVKHDPHIKKLVEGRKKVNPKLPNPEIDIRFPNCFFTHATVNDYLQLLRLNKKITTVEMAKRLDMEVADYVTLESQINYDSTELVKYSKQIGEALGIGDFKDWMLFVYTETPNQSFIDSYDPKDVLTEVKVTVPSIVKKYDEEGHVYFQRYTEEQLVQNFRNLEHILGDDRLITYNGRVLNRKDKKKILQMIDILLD